MDTYEVVDLVNDHMTYKPHWEIRAAKSLFPGMVRVTYEFWSDNSSPRDIDPRPRVRVDGDFLVECDGRDLLEIERQVLDGLIEAEIHEVREFLRFDGRAPFHPHRADGDYAWES